MRARAGNLFLLTLLSGIFGPGCASHSGDPERKPSCAVVKVARVEDRMPAETTALPEGARETFGHWLLAYREAEDSQSRLDHALADPGVQEKKKLAALRTELGRLSVIRARLERIRLEWARLSRQSGSLETFRDLIREASLDSVFGPKLDRAAFELKAELTSAESERDGCSIERRPAQARGVGALAWASSPSLHEISAQELLVHAGFAPSLAAKLAKKPSLKKKSTISAEEIDALDWLDPDGHSILRRVEKLRAAGVRGEVRIRTEQPHALWVRERLLESRPD